MNIWNYIIPDICPFSISIGKYLKEYASDGSNQGYIRLEVYTGHLNFSFLILKKLGCIVFLLHNNVSIHCWKQRTFKISKIHLKFFLKLLMKVSVNNMKKISNTFITKITLYEILGILKKPCQNKIFLKSFWESE